MYNIWDNQREIEECQCPCHCHCPCLNQELFNKSEIISDINIQNPKSDFFSSNFNNNSPLFNPKEIYNYTYSPNLNNRCQIRKMRLRERAQSIKDKINSKDFLRNINKTKNNWNNSNNNNNNKFENYYTFQLNNIPLNKSISFLKNKIKNINDENKYLQQLLSKVPRHDKNPHSSKSYMDKLRRSFTMGNFGKIPNDLKCSFKNKKYQGYSSMVMPPNDIDNIVIKNNAYI